MTSGRPPTAGNSRPGDADVLDQLLLELDGVQRSIDAVRGLVNDLRTANEDLRSKHDVLTGAVASLRAEVDVLSAGVSATRARVWWWPDLTAQEARSAWETLTTWMREVLVVRYPDVGRVLPPCWFRHADALDALTVLYTTWLGAYRDPAAPPTTAAVWRNQWLPAGIAQLKAALRSCDWTSHRDERGHLDNTDRCFDDELARFIANDIARRASE